MTNSLTRAIQDIVLENNKPAKQIAQEVGKPYPTLLREINPFDSGAKVGVETLVPLMRATNSVTPLEILAEEVGCVVAPVSRPTSGRHAMNAALEQIERLVELSSSLRKAVVRGEMSRDETERTLSVSSNAAIALLSLREHLRAAAEEERLDSAAAFKPAHVA